jgi:hypothetical protein
MSLREQGGPRKAQEAGEYTLCADHVPTNCCSKGTGPLVFPCLYNLPRNLHGRTNAALQAAVHAKLHPADEASLGIANFLGYPGGIIGMTRRVF